MSKTAKNVIIIFIVIAIILTASMLIATYCFKPNITLNYCYKELENSGSYLLRGYGLLTEDDYISVVKYDIDNRFSHYEPPILTRDGYTFAGWYKDIGYTVAWINGEDTVTRDITLYAKWIENS
jgi:uncharacterized repeat protein (TIGR02543 family)